MSNPLATAVGKANSGRIEKDMTSHSNDLLQLDQQVCFPLYAASNLLTRAYRPILADLGLTYPQYLVMLALWEKSPLTVGELGNKLWLDSGTLTPLLKRMEGSGIVERRRDAEDERRVLINLTPQGRALRGKARKVPETLSKRLGLSHDDATSLRSAVQSVIRTLAHEQSSDDERTS